MTNRLFLLLVVVFAACGDKDSVSVVRVSLLNTETYQQRWVVGDEEGAAVSTQARHYRISEVRRDSTTNWDAVYFYQPAAGFVGSDFAAIRVYRGSDGAGPSTDIQEVRFYFSVAN
jgi:hypothetical protein